MGNVAQVFNNRRREMKFHIPEEVKDWGMVCLVIAILAIISSFMEEAL